MSKKKSTPGGRPKKNTEVSLVRSSAAEYLTFVAAGGNSEASVEVRYEDENIPPWRHFMVPFSYRSAAPRQF